MNSYRLRSIWQFYRNGTDFSTDSKQTEQADWQIKSYMISCFWGWTLHALQASPAHGQFSCQFYSRGSFSLISSNLITSQLRCKSLVASAPIAISWLDKHPGIVHLLYLNAHIGHLKLYKTMQYVIQNPSIYVKQLFVTFLWACKVCSRVWKQKMGPELQLNSF